MVAYMFQFELPADFTSEMEAIIPSHREHINQLFSEGKLLSYSVAQKRTSVWAIVVAENEQEALEIVAAMPLHPYFTEVMCHPLLFHNTNPAPLPEISLN